MPGNTNDPWQTARTPPRRDPLALDLDGDGIETLGLSADGLPPVLFDHDADGLKTGTGWLAGDDAWLVHDLDGNGLVDSGRELFGVDTLIEGEILVGGVSFWGTRTAYDGFEALRALDSGAGNGTDGAYDLVFDARDAAFGTLRLWRDLDRDGVSEPGELSTLASQGIASISLAATHQTQDLGNGNTLTATATVTRSDGGHIDVSGVGLTAGNLDLASNPFYREFTDTVPLTESAAALPEMGGSGWLRDLHEAMSLGTPEAQALVAQVQAFAAASTRPAQDALLDPLLQAWAATSGRLNGFYPYLDGYATEEFSYTDRPNTNGTVTRTFGTIDQAHWDLDPRGDATLVLYQFNETALMAVDADTRSSDWDAPNEAGWAWLHRRNVLETFNGQRFFGFEQVVTGGGGGGAGDGSGGSGSGGQAPAGPRVATVYRVTSAQREAIDQSYGALRDSVFQALAMQTRLRAHLDKVMLVIEENSVRFDTVAMQARLEARYVAEPEAGLTDLVDLVRFATPTLDAIGLDALGLLRTWTEALPAGSPLLASARGAGLTLGPALAAGPGADVWLGDATASTIDGKGGNDVLDAGAGNDSVRGGEGHDTLRGGAGGDWLYGDAGDDFIDGGAGNDNLYGGSGQDGYRWAPGGGNDRIDEQATADPGVDRLEITAAAPSEVRVSRNVGDDLLLTITASGEVLTVVDGFREGYESKWVESVRFDDGTEWSLAQLRTLALTGTAGADALYGHATDDTITGGDGNDTLGGNAGHDVLLASAGNDYLYGHDGDDQLDGGDGNDVAYGGNGHDLQLGGAGADILHGDAGDDTLDGGVGSDTLRGGSGHDLYRWAPGGGSDQVDEQTSAESGADRLQITNTVPTGVAVSRNAGDDLVLKLALSGETLTVADGFREGYDFKWLESVVFDDGTSWSLTQMRTLALTGTAGADTLYGHTTDDTITGGDGNDTLGGNAGHDLLLAGTGNDYLYGHDGDDRLDGGDGNDSAYGGNGNDVLLGGAGSDVLFGEAGDDLMEGGVGIDSLRGGSGHDTYRWAPGSGNDLVDEQATTDPGTDRLEIGGAAPSSVAVSRNAGDDLVLKLLASGETLTVVDGFREGYESKWVESVAFAGGIAWSVEQMRTLALTGTAGADALYGHTTDDTITGGDGNDTLGGNAGHDLLLAGTGNDYVYGHDGDDRLDAGDGSDIAHGGNGQDTLLGGAGTDQLQGDAGHDTLDGGIGNDALRGGSGNDLYRWAPGGGNDLVDEQSTTDPGTDRIDLGGAAPSGVRVARNSGDDLVLTLAASGETLTVVDGFREGDEFKWVESVRFDDGTEWTLAQMRAMLPASSPRLATSAGGALGLPPRLQDLLGLRSPASASTQADRLIDAMAAFGSGAVPAGPWGPLSEANRAWAPGLLSAAAA